jgi:hypothetical protein
MEEYHHKIKELKNKRHKIDESIRDSRKEAVKTWLGPLYGKIKPFYVWSDAWGLYQFRICSTGEVIQFEIAADLIRSINDAYAPEDGWKDLRRVKMFRELSKDAQQFVLLVFNQLKIDHIETIELIKLI